MVAWSEISGVSTGQQGHETPRSSEGVDASNSEGMPRGDRLAEDCMPSGDRRALIRNTSLHDNLITTGCGRVRNGPKGN